MVVALHSLQFRVHTRVLLTLLIACAIAGVMWADSPTRQLIVEAAAAQKAGQSRLALEKLEAARLLRPDYPRLHLQLARLHAAQGEHALAMDRLSSLADFGLALDLSRDPALSALPQDERWTTIVRRFAANAEPQGRPVVEITLPAADGIIEAAVRDSQGRWFFADVRNRSITRRDADGRMHEFSRAEDDLRGVFSLVLDEPRDRLWASISSVPEVKGHDANEKGAGAVLEYQLSTGTRIRKIAVPASTPACVLGSLALAQDGTIFASDSATPIIWRVADNGARLEPWLQSAEFVSLQGLAFSSDGSALYVADYANGIWRIDPATKQTRLLRAPAGTTLFGIDDLRLTGHALIGVQNGITPQRIIRVALDAAGEAHAVSVLAAADARMTDLAGGAIGDGRFHFIANSGWSLFERPDSTPAPRAVHVLSLPL